MAHTLMMARQALQLCLCLALFDWLAVARGADADDAWLNPAPALGTTCSKTLTAELTQGPYYLDDILFRSDITEGQAGVPLKLRVYLLDTSCNPIEDAFISIWHANATGMYSGFTGTTTSGGVAASQTDDLTFMRGLVMTDAQGLATFETVYPGTYEGRTPHIHVKAFVPTHNLTTTNETAKYEDSHLVHTGQFFNTDALNRYVRKVYPYSTNTKPTLLKLEDDHIYTSDSRSDAERQVLSFEEVKKGNASAGLIATINAIVDKTASYSSILSTENDVDAAAMSAHKNPNSGAIKATFIISGLMVFAVVAATVAIRTGFVDSMRGRQTYQNIGDSHTNRPSSGLQLS